MRVFILVFVVGKQTSRKMIIGRTAVRAYLPGNPALSPLLQTPLAVVCKAIRARAINNGHKRDLL